MKSNKIYFSKLLSVIMICLIALSCNKKTPEKEAESGGHAHDEFPEAASEDLQITSRQYKAAGIELGAIQQTSLGETIKTSGTLDVPPQNFAEVSAYIGGIIKSISIFEGDYVKKGQTIMTLEHPDFLKLQEEYTNVKNSISFLEKDYLRQKELYDEKISSGKIFQEAESRYNTEKGRLNSLASQLTMLGISVDELDKGNFAKVISLKSPINGYIAHVHGTIGAYAEPNKMLFDVIDNSHIHVHLDVYEKDFYRIKIGQKISVILPNQNNEMIEGEIFNIGKAMDNETKSIAVHAEVTNNKKRELIPGVFVNALIHVGTKNASAVPSEAVVRSADKEFVFIVNDSLCSKPAEKGKDPYSVKDAQGNVVPLCYKMIEVQSGTEDMGLIEISPVKELSSKNQIVIKGAYYLMSALKSGETVGCCAPEEEEGDHEEDEHGH